jgi:hypothetical protein
VTTIDELEDVREDLESLLLDVLNSVLGEDAYPVEETIPTGPVAISRLAIHDEIEDSYLGVEIRVGTILGRLLASRMMMAGDPSPDDLLDAVGELGNMAGGNVKTLLFHTARLSLPNAELTEADIGAPDTGLTVRAGVFGQVAELSVVPDAHPDGLYWPPSMTQEELERQP